MLPLIQWLNGRGSEVYLLQLAGHRPGSADPAQVTAELWRQEIKTVYGLARAAAESEGLPLYFLGYSLGALLAQSVLALPAEAPPFERQVLLAPALSLRRRTGLLRWLCGFQLNLLLPSFTPVTYRANKSLPLSIYRILFAEVDRLQNKNLQQLNVPTLVIMDAKDELVSSRGLRRLIEKQGLNKYRLLLLAGRRQRFRHLILDRETMGAENWAKATAAMEVFLFER